MASAPAPGAWRERLHAALLELGMQFTADAIEHSTVAEARGEFQFTTPDEFRLAMNEKDILKAVQKIAGKPMRIKVKFGEAETARAGPRSASPLDDANNARSRIPRCAAFRKSSPTPRCAWCAI